MLLWNQVDTEKHFKKDHVHMRLCTRLYGIRLTVTKNYTTDQKMKMIEDYEN